MGGSIESEVTRIEETRRRYHGHSMWAHDVNIAVYWAPGWKDWQRFRLSLKGESIERKLMLLKDYWARCDREDINERIRVYNYLGALLRGGFEEARPMYNAFKRGDV